MVYVFVETNFLLNIALKQEEYRSSYKLLRLAEENKIRLCTSNLCISEAYWALAKKNQSQIDVRDRVNELITDALRSSYSRKTFENYGQIPTDIEKKLNKELKMLDINIARVLKIAELIEHNKTIHQKGVLYRSRLNIKHEPDAFIVSAIIWHKTNNMSPTSQDLFVTTDSDLINEPKVKQLLNRKKIELKSSFKESIETLKNWRIF